MDFGPHGWAAPLYERALDMAGVGPRTRVLDIGCGAGGFAAAAVARGAFVHGVDIDGGAVARAAADVPGASFAVGDAHDLGATAPVDVAAAVQLLAHVTNPVRVLQEAARVAPAVVATVWGREEECDMRAFGEALAQWLPPRRPAPGPPPVTDPERLRTLVTLAGLRTSALVEVVCPFRYPDEEAVLESLFASGLGRHVINRQGPVAVREAVLARLEPHRTRDGGHVLENLFRVLVADATSGTPVG